MPIQSNNRRFDSSDPMARKADQEWDMAGLARADGDLKAAERHTERARAFERGEDPDHVD